MNFESLKRRIFKLLIGSLLAISIPSLLAQSSYAATDPQAPTLTTIPVQVLADNDIDIFLGSDAGPTRLFYQNAAEWHGQLSAAQTLDIVPSAGETYIYVLAMGGGGAEEWGGTINGIDVVSDYPGAQVAIDPIQPLVQAFYFTTDMNGQPCSHPMDYPMNGFNSETDEDGCNSNYNNQSLNAFYVDNYLDIGNDITGFATHNGNCSGSNCNTVAGGGFIVDTNTLIGDVQKQINSSTQWERARFDQTDQQVDGSPYSRPLPVSTWPNPFATYSYDPCAICSGVPSNQAWAFPSNHAVMFRYPVSNLLGGALAPIIPGDQAVMLNWNPPTNGLPAGGYEVRYRATNDVSGPYLYSDPIDQNATSAYIVGLTNGVSYTFEILTSDDGITFAHPSNSKTATPAREASAPTILSYTTDTTTAYVSITPPTDTGGYPITNYDYSTDGGSTWLPVAPPSTGLTIPVTKISMNGAFLVPTTTYNVSVRAETNYGFGDASAPVLLSLLPYAVTYHALSSNNSPITSGTAPVDTSSPYLAGSSATALPNSNLALANYDFAGWCRTNNNSNLRTCTGGLIAPNDLLTNSIQGNIDLYAVWTPRFLVDFSSLGSAVASETYTGTALVKPADPTRANYSFRDWVDSSTNTISWPYTPSGPTTLTARWLANAPNQYTVSVTQGTGGTITPSTTAVTSGANQTFTFAANNGYTIQGITIDGSSLTGSSLTNAINSGYTFSNVTSAHSVTATYVANSPAPIVQPSVQEVVIPVQQSKIISMSPHSTNVGSDVTVVMEGQFIEPITNITVGIESLPVGSWKQTPTSVSFTSPNKAIGTYAIQLYNGADPLMTPQVFAYMEAPAKVIQAPTPTPVMPVVPEKPTEPTVKKPPLAADLSLKVYFDLASYAVDANNLQKLRALSAKISGLGTQITVSITGYAQPTPGSAATDGALSRNRAAQIAKILRANGVNTQIKYKGAGRAALNVPSSRYVEIVASNS